jgi:hypothetical protein
MLTKKPLEIIPHLGCNREGSKIPDDVGFDIS